MLFLKLGIAGIRRGCLLIELTKAQKSCLKGVSAWWLGLRAISLHVHSEGQFVHLMYEPGQ